MHHHHDRASTGRHDQQDRSSQAGTRALALALALIAGFTALEVVSGVLGHSLALLSDAGHMLVDAYAIGISLLATRIAGRPAKGALTYGWGRVDALSAQFNGATLLLLAALIVYAAVGRLISPPHSRGALMLAVALGGVVVNLLAARVLSRGRGRSMSLEGSYQHVLTDLYAFIGTAAAGLVIITTGFLRADAIASLLIALLMLRSAYGLLRDSGRIFLEAAPKGLDPQELGSTMAAHPGVGEVHDLHVWEVGSGFPALSAHVLVERGRDCHEVRRELEATLRERFDIEHSTLQVDHAGAELLELELPDRLRRGGS